MDLGLKGKVALVAASSRGLGRAIAHTLAREGATVAMCARNKNDLEAAADAIVGRWFKYPSNCDHHAPAFHFTRIGYPLPGHRHFHGPADHLFRDLFRGRFGTAADIGRDNPVARDTPLVVFPETT